MNNEAEYSISRVRYDHHNRRIQLVRVHTEPSHFLLGNYARHQVVESIGRGDRWITILQDDVHWRRGADIHVVVVNGREYLGTDRNEVEEDNLGELPEF